MGGLMVMPDSPIIGETNALETSFTTINSATSGYITSTDTAYADALSGAGGLAVHTNDAYFRVEHEKNNIVWPFPAIIYEISRNFLSFNTTTISSTDRILSCEFGCRPIGASVEPTTLELWSCEYGDTITGADWSVPANYVCDLFTIDTWGDFTAKIYDLPQNTINRSGVTQFELRHDDEGVAPGDFLPRFVDMIAEAFFMRIMAVTETEAVITYNFTAGSGMTNRTTNIYPVEIIDWGSQDLYRYEFWSSNQSYNNFTMPVDDFTYLSINPYASVTQIDARNWTITDLTANAMYWIWFTYNKTAYCQGRFSLYHNATGEGMSFDSWAVYINTGLHTDIISMEQVWNAECELTLGTIYTISIYDFFPTPNFITNYTFIAVNETMNIDVPIPVYALTLSSISQYDIEIEIYLASDLLAPPLELFIPSKAFIVQDLVGTDYNISATFLNLGVTKWYNQTITANTLIRINGTCEAFIALFRESTGTGVPFGDWQVFINEGNATDNTTFTQVSKQETELKIGQEYTISIYDYFPDPNFICNHTFTAISEVQVVKVEIPFAPLNFKSFRDDFTAFRIWFNSNLSYSPFQDHIPPQEWYAMSIRGGQWMIAVDYLSTTINGSASILSSYFLNITSNSSVAYSIKISNNSISTILTTALGMEITLNQITTAIANPVNFEYYAMPRPNMDSTRDGFPDPHEDATRAIVMLEKNYNIIDANVVVNYTNVTSANYWYPAPTTGYVEIIDDTLMVFGDWNTRVMLNRTGGANFVNLTHPQLINLGVYADSGNFSVWSNKSVNLYRNTEFRQTNIFSWSYSAELEKYSVSLTINASRTPYPWTHIHWFVPKVAGTTMDTEINPPTIYDQNNSAFLTSSNYTLNLFGFHLVWDSLSLSTFRAFTFTFFVGEAQYETTEIIIIEEYEIDENYNNAKYWVGQATYSNDNAYEFIGEIVIKLENLEGTIDPASIVVIDDTNERTLGTNEYTWSGNSIGITRDAILGASVDVGYGVLPGKSRTYTIYFQYSETDAEDLGLFTPWFKLFGVPMSFHMLILFIAIAIIVLVAVFYRGEAKYKMMFYEFAGLIFGLWAVMLILQLQGVIG